MTRRSLVLLLLAGCPEADDDDDEQASSTSTGDVAEDSADVPCDACGDDPSCHSSIGDSGHCVCEPGHEWADVGNAEDFTCVPIPPRPQSSECGADNHSMMLDGQCYCESGYNWCTDDPTDLSCCADPSQSGESTG